MLLPLLPLLSITLLDVHSDSITFRRGQETNTHLRLLLPGSPWLPFMACFMALLVEESTLSLPALPTRPSSPWTLWRLLERRRLPRAGRVSGCGVLRWRPPRIGLTPLFGSHVRRGASSLIPPFTYAAKILSRLQEPRVTVSSISRGVISLSASGKIHQVSFRSLQKSARVIRSGYGRCWKPARQCHKSTPFPVRTR